MENSCLRFDLSQPLWNRNITKVHLPVRPNINQLTTVQKEMLCELALVIPHSQCWFYDDVPGWSSKIFTFNFLCKYVRAMHHTVSRTGVAVILLSEAKALHCFFKLSVLSVCNVSPPSQYTYFMMDPFYYWRSYNDFTCKPSVTSVDIWGMSPLFTLHF